MGWVPLIQLKKMARSRKDSFYWYKKVIESNGADLE